MDPITHGLFGTITTQSFAIKKLQKYCWLVGFLAAMAPDLDIFIRSSKNPLLLYFYHRHFSHSLLFIPMGGLIVGLFCLLIAPKLRLIWPWVVFTAIIAYGTHGPLDSLTSYGTLLLWPFSYKRISWDLFSIIDPVVTLILLGGALFASQQNRRLPAVIALLLSLFYLSFAFLQHHRAIIAQQELIAKRQQTVIKSRVIPLFGHLFRWRSIYFDNEKIALDDITTPISQPTTVSDGLFFDRYRDENLPLPIRENLVLLHDYEVFKWFCDDFITAFSQQPLVIVDMRYLLALHPTRALWAVEFPTEVANTGQHARWIYTLKHP